MGWVSYNNMWKRKTITDGPSLKMWWIVKNTVKRKRWVVKNLKRFCEENAFHLNPNSRWYKLDLQQFYQDMTISGRSYRGWSAAKPYKHEELYNILGTKDLKIFKGAYCREVPYDEKKFKLLCENGITTEIKEFWGKIDFTF